MSWELRRESPDFSTFQIAILQQQAATLAWAEGSDLLQEVAAPQGSWSCLLNAKDRGSYTSMWVITPGSLGGLNMGEEEEPELGREEICSPHK